MLFPIAFGELQASLVAIKARSFPLNRPIVRTHRPDEGRQQIDGAVEVVKHRPRYLTGQGGKHVLDPKRQFQSVPKMGTE